MGSHIKSLISVRLIVTLIFYLCSLLNSFGQGNMQNNISGSYESSNKKYLLHLIQVNPSSYYYEFLPRDINDSIAISNINNGLLDEQLEDDFFITSYTGAFQSGFEFRYSGDDIMVGISRFSYDYRYSDLKGKYSKLKNGDIPKPHYDMFYNKDKYQIYRGAVKSKGLYLCYYPSTSTKDKMIKINKMTKLKLLATVFNFALGDMSYRYYYVEMSNGNSKEFGWLDYRDLKYFKLIGKT